MTKQTCKLKLTQIYYIQHLVVLSWWHVCARVSKGKMCLQKIKKFFNNEYCARAGKRSGQIVYMWKFNQLDTEIYVRSRNGKGDVRVQSDLQRAIAYFPGTCDIGAFGASDRKQFTFMSKNNCEGN